MPADFGFDGLGRVVEMIEERLGRLGRPVSNTVIVVVVLAIITFCVNHIIEEAVLPTWHLAENIQEHSGSWGGAVYKGAMIVAAIVVWLAVIVFSIFFATVVRRDIKHIRRYAPIAEKRNQKAAEILDMISTKAQAVANKEMSNDDYRRLFEDIDMSLQSFFDDMQRDAANLGLATAPPEQPHPVQAQQGTPERT